MAEATMPVTEAESLAQGEEERQSYELAFHILPTVAEEEVPAVFEAIKTAITKDGGELFDEEAPERFMLAYEVVRHLEGKNRKFQSAYFGWVRFRAEGEVVAKLTHELEINTNILRHLIIRLTRAEEQNPFRFHENIKDQKMVTTVGESKVVPDFTTVSEEGAASKVEEGGEVDEAALEKALEDKEV